MKTTLDIEFEEAFKKISDFKKKLAPDTMLKFYAFFKQATLGNHSNLNMGENVRNAFKFNAWIQLKGMSPDEAKRKYISLAKSVL